jgi:hypothetical protein
VLSQLGKKKHKYLNLSIQETALKFLAIALKADNQYRDDAYRAKYHQKLQQFISVCEMSEKLANQFERKGSLDWQPWDEDNLLKEATEFDAFQQEMRSTDKREHFTPFIR